MYGNVDLAGFTQREPCSSMPTASIASVRKVSIRCQSRRYLTLCIENAMRVANHLSEFANRHLERLMNHKKFRGLADREGFEPPIPLRVCRISSAVHSTTLPPVRGRLRSKRAGYYTPHRTVTSLLAVINPTNLKPRDLT